MGISDYDWCVYLVIPFGRKANKPATKVDFDLDEGPTLTAVFPPTMLSSVEAENMLVYFGLTPSAASYLF